MSIVGRPTAPGFRDVQNFGCLVPVCDGTPVPACPIPLCVTHVAEVMRFVNESVNRGTSPRGVSSVNGPRVVPSKQPRAQTYGLVYFIQLNGLIKIGKTKNLKARLSSFSHPEIEVLATEPGYTVLESKLHRRFADHQVRGEWFRPHPDLMQYIEDVRSRA